LEKGLLKKKYFESETYGKAPVTWLSCIKSWLLSGVCKNLNVETAFIFQRFCTGQERQLFMQLFK